MMLVKILGFGSSWWGRFGHDLGDRYRFTRHAAYFNSTGLRCGNKIRRHWSVAGLIRFNGVGGFNPHFPARSVGATFECADVVFSLGGNRVLFLRKAAHSTRPDRFLVVMCSDRFGTFDCQTIGWKSASVVPIAISELSDRQEAMLLMKPLGWVQTALGVWQLKTDPALRYGVALELLEDPVMG